MNIDDLVNSINEPDFKVELNDWVYKWKNDDADVMSLYELVAKWYGNVWFVDQSNQNLFWKNLQLFKINAVDCINGMTLNERLYWFGLIDKWDNSNKNVQEKIRNKLHAPT